MLGKYIADFYCAKANVVIELDGSQHYEDEGLISDEKRTAYLEQYGIKVIRISNLDVLKNFDGVCMYIDNAVLEKMMMTIVEGFDRIEKKLDRMERVKEFLNGDELLDNYDIARLLNVSLRTVARYREKGLIRYYQTDDNGKNFYRSSEIQEFLLKRGKKK